MNEMEKFVNELVKEVVEDGDERMALEVLKRIVAKGMVVKQSNK